MKKIRYVQLINVANWARETKKKVEHARNNEENMFQYFIMEDLYGTATRTIIMISTASRVYRRVCNMCKRSKNNAVETEINEC